MVNEWDRYNNPMKGQYRDPETAIANLVVTTNAGKKQNLYPFGSIKVIDSDGNESLKLRFPKYYETKFSNEENWKENCYNIIQCAANRHFWFLLTLEKKLQLYKFIMNHLHYKIYKMANTYTFEDLLTDLTKYQFTDDNSEFIDWIFTSNNVQISQFKDVKYVTYGSDYLIKESIKPWEQLTYENMKDNLEIVNLDKEEFYIRPGQYIMNFTDPYGQQRW